MKEIKEKVINDALPKNYFNDWLWSMKKDDTFGLVQTLTNHHTNSVFDLIKYESANI